MKRVFAGLAILAIVCSLSLAQGSRSEDKSKGGAADERFSDQHFVTKASASDLAEINLGRLAAQRGSSSEVKQFGQKMVQDHTKASTELLKIADSKNLTPAQQMDQKHQQALQKLSGLQGTEFDRAYLKQLVTDHEEAVQLFTQASKHCRDQDLKAFATRTLPAIQEHLQMVKRHAGQESPVSKQGESK